MNFDRTVHAVLADGSEIVRYDRASKWYLEHPDRQRRRLPIKEAAQLVIDDRASRWYLGRPGGSRFDGLVIQRRSTETAVR